MKSFMKRFFKGLGFVTSDELNKVMVSYDKLYKLLESKISENKEYTDILLYELNLAKSHKKKNFNPKVSIIIPVYNGSDYLERAILCSLNQTYKNIEIIVVNDGSTDDNKSRIIAEKYKKWIKYYEKENGGVSSALNYGIKKMSGDYFAWLSHDDLIEKEHIEKLVEYVSVVGHEKHIPYSAFKIVDENEVIKIDESINAQLHCFDYKTSVLKNYFTLLKGEINGGSVLIPKEAFDKYGYFDEKQRITQERDMWSRLINEYEFICIPYATAIIRSHSKQVTNTNPRIKLESNTKNLDIIKSVPIDKIKELSLNEQSFYKVLSYYYRLNSNDDLAEEIEKLIEDSKKMKKKMNRIKIEVNYAVIHMMTLNDNVVKTLN